MKKSIIAIAALIVAGAAQAESSVTLYGLVDAGVTFVNNQSYKDSKGVQQHSSNFRMDSGVMNGNRWGLRVREELSDGIAAVARVESGFKLDDGSSGQGGKLFGRQAFAGLDVKDVGTVTFGRQYDFMGDLGDYTAASNQFGGNYMLESSDSFHTDSGLGSRVTGGRVDNSIKFQSANIGGSGVTAGVMVGLGEKASDKKAGRTISAAIGYDGIPNFSTKVAYTQTRDMGTDAVAPYYEFDNPSLPNSQVVVINPGKVATASKKTQNFGLGASYDLGFGKVNGLFTSTKADNFYGASLDGKANVYEAGYTHRVTPQLSAGLGYQYFDNRTAGHKKDDIHGVNIALDYAFSKRTDAYFLTVFNKAKGTAIANITGSGASDGKNQVAVRVGLRHRF